MCECKQKQKMYSTTIIRKNILGDQHEKCHVISRSEEVIEERLPLLFKNNQDMSIRIKPTISSVPIVSTSIGKLRLFTAITTVNDTRVWLVGTDVAQVATFIKSYLPHGHEVLNVDMKEYPVYIV